MLAVVMHEHVFADNRRVVGSTCKPVETDTWNLRMSRGLPAFFKQFWLHFKKNFSWNLSQTTGSDGVSFLFPQLFFSQQRLQITSWVSKTLCISGFLMWLLPSYSTICL